jgi:hypothetical protein
MILYRAYLEIDYPDECEHVCPRCATMIPTGPYARFSHDVYSRKDWESCPGEDRVLCPGCQAEMTEACLRCGHSRADHWRGFDANLVLISDCAIQPCERCGCRAEIDERGEEEEQ